ncbi:hypothetical protein PSHT_11277 [Puccinia striiformis]|uniref:Uncharacterized protein n=1 Tax=Puccinia striiformis TaxID=27350 RepID=A0A2S4V4R2_9BASI|nr:hypothetical protein PSHT_11277 [Puccinia striiformis]
MHVSVYRSIMALLFQILVLVSIIESMPVKFVPTTEPHPMAGHYRDTPVRGCGSNCYRPSEDEVNEIVGRIRRMNSQQRAKVGAKWAKLNAPPKPKTRLRRLWDRFLSFFGRRRRPVDVVLDKTKAVAGASVGPIVTGLSLGALTGWLLCMGVNDLGCYPIYGRDHVKIYFRQQGVSCNGPDGASLHPSRRPGNHGCSSVIYETAFPN